MGWRYIKSIFRKKGLALRLFMLVLLAVLGALLEGAGMGFLVPIIESLQDQAYEGGHRSGLSEMASRLFPFTLPYILAVGVGLSFTQLALVYQASSGKDSRHPAERLMPFSGCGT